MRKMVELGWIEKRKGSVNQARELLNFFGIASPAQWHEVFELPQASFRHTTAFESETGSLAAWLRKGELQGQEIRCAPFDRERFKSVLMDARQLTREPPEVFGEVLVERCASAGAPSRSSRSSRSVAPTARLGGCHPRKH